MGESLQRGRQRHRPRASGERRAAHHHRRHAGVVRPHPEHRRALGATGADVRAIDEAQRTISGARRAIAPRSRVNACRRHRDDGNPRFARERSQPTRPRDRLQRRRAGLRGRLRGRLQSAPHHPSRRGRVRAADRVHERREPVDRARHHARSRALHPRRARRGTRPSRATAPDRVPRALDDSRRSSDSDSPMVCCNSC